MSERTEIVQPCWTTRYEAEGYDDWVEWFWHHFDQGRDVLACPHQPSHTDADNDTYESCRFAMKDMLCDQDAGHAGPHTFVPDDAIVLVFA